MKESFQKYGLFYLFLFLLIIFILLFTYSLEDKNELTLSVLDVGQGDSIFIESPTGIQVLIDGGRGKEVLTELSKQMSFFDHSIDVVIMTNPDLDHIGGFLEVFKKYKVERVFEPGTYNDSTVYKEIEKNLKDKNIKRLLGRADTTINLGDGAYLEILFPDTDVATWNNNDGSMVTKLVYGNNSFMLTGDASIKTEKLLLEKYPAQELKADFLKVGHHGSRTSTSREFLEIVKPKYALISSGEDNKYGHPHKEVLGILESFGVEILRTDTLGTIVFSCAKIGMCKLK